MENNLNWYESVGIDGDVVISSRVRLARNIKNIPFPERCTPAQQAEINKLTASAAGGGFDCVDMDDLATIDILALAERNIISRDFAGRCKGKELLISKTEPVSIMVGEEDHIRISSIVPGLDLLKAYENADNTDSRLESMLDYAYDTELGYLTACPTNLGTGMRASVMMHLPALYESGAMGRIAASLSKIGLTIRGCYGEGSEAAGAMFQLSNQITLGLDEKGAIDNLINIAKRFVIQEREAREKLRSSVNTEDKIFRSLGLLKCARKLSTAEFMNLISYVRLGVALNLIDDITLPNINSIIIKAQPANIVKQAAKELNVEERDIERAALVRKALV